MEAGSTAYMLVFRESSPESYEVMSAEQRRQALQEWNDWCDSFAAKGMLQHGHPLEPGGRTISAARGVRAVDGPFAEAKELIGGYLLVNASDLDEVTAMAERCPSLQYGLTIEIRPVAGACHLARSLGWETMREPARA